MHKINIKINSLSPSLSLSPHCVCVCACVIMLTLFALNAFALRFTMDRGQSVVNFMFLHHFGMSWLSHIIRMEY